MQDSNLEFHKNIASFAKIFSKQAIKLPNLPNGHVAIYDSQ